jgi:hypothetical protein
VILDGTPIPIDRVAEDRPYYSGKHKRHGVNVQTLADTRGSLGRVHLRWTFQPPGTRATTPSYARTVVSTRFSRPPG